MPASLSVETAAPLASAADRLRQIAASTVRPDLLGRIDAASRTLADATVRVVVVGQFKQGKSSLVNALVAADVCPVDDIVATAVPTEVRWGQQVSAALVTTLTEDARTIRTPIAPDQLRRLVTERSGAPGAIGTLHAEVTLPRAALAGGLVLVDTPGVGRGNARAATNLTLLPDADAIVMVSDATQELTDPELRFLQQAAALCGRVTFVLSKHDLQHQWRSIHDADREHLADADVDARIIPTSAFLHSVALRDQTPGSRERSGIDQLAAHLQGPVRADVVTQRQLAAAEEIVAVGRLLAMVAQSELDVLLDPASGGVVVHDLERAQKTAEQLTQRSARWQQTLADGVEELIADVDFDLRDRLRKVGREAERLIDSSDPGRSWEQIGAWLADSVTQAVSDNFVWAHERSLHLAGVVADHFSLDGRAALPELSLAGTDQALRAVGGLDFIGSGRLGIGKKLMIGLKGSYGGVLMFGLMTSLAGMALVNPLSLAAGLVVGTFAYRQDAQTRLDGRRAEAKAAVRRLIDEAIFQVGKEARDRSISSKRVLREHFVGVGESFKQSLAESVRLAKRGADMPKPERQLRVERLTADLAELRALCEQAASFSTAHASVALRSAS
ncbi:isoniazid-induced dynamin-like GTPase IniA [Agrococcus versicolor]|uniref:Isoniazid-induced dynamin-like GTPase IniA n=1 Tax=Agrococcus versicolor TaxID=501482 RepID=A0ABP5MEQ0_9MICO